MPDFFASNCQQYSNKNLFGICDNIDIQPAFLDETNGKEWIAVVENGYKENVCFTAVDNCVEIWRPDGTMESRCDGMLTYQHTLIFVELKDSKKDGSEWVRKGDVQLRSTIAIFEGTTASKTFKSKKAYIANKAKPRFREGQMQRMDRFFKETGYVLRVESRIKLD
jgi:hypothetical protein